MRAAILTISDGCFHHQREDASGPALGQILGKQQWEIASTQVLPDELSRIQEAIRALTQDAQEIGLIVTTGGTGLGPRDVTPEAIGPLPRLEKYEPVLLVAVNQEYSDLDSLVSPGDEVSFFPPVSGGAR